MNETITLTPTMLGLIPVVALILQVLKQVPHYTKIKPYTPVIAMVIGVGVSVAASVANPVIVGIMIGMAASTGYDQFKASKPE